MDTIPETIRTPGAANSRPVEVTPHLLDWQWVFEQRQSNPTTFRPYRGLLVAVYEKQVVGSAPLGPGAAGLAQRVAAGLGVPSDRPVVTYIEDFE